MSGLEFNPLESVFLFWSRSASPSQIRALQPGAWCASSPQAPGAGRGPGQGCLQVPLLTQNPKPATLRSHGDLKADKSDQAFRSSSSRPEQSKEGARGEGPFVGVGIGGWGTCLKFYLKKGICRQIAQGPSPHTALCTVPLHSCPSSRAPRKSPALGRFR